MQDQQGGTGRAAGARGAGPVAAFVLAFVVGPIGAVMGWLERRRAQSGGRPVPALANAAVLVGLVQTVVVAGLGIHAMNSPQQPATVQAAVESAIDARTPGPRATSSLEPVPEPSQTADYPHGLPPEVGGLQAGEAAPAPGLVADGATDAVTSTYTDGSGGDIQVVSSTWPDEAAAAAAAEKARADFTEAQLIKTGAVGVPTRGTYWYYVKGDVATEVISLGTQTIVITGNENDVQTFGGLFLYS